ncbi:hypothetical protein L1987_59867 [Smallanthus sonchifolius]|uniref:Uncharacterized protein n=1 Tax=Smallanthus sonchifolius TaxID=185202 RepID=A0ACB9D6I9_9ASTR|nr:hypothetical protein L1987_59867 [Smallanthus sonchifolius]
MALKIPNSLKNWKDHFFYVSSGFLSVQLPRRDVNTPIEDPPPDSSTYEDGLCVLLYSRPSPIVVYDEPLLVLAGVSQNWDTHLLRPVPGRNGVEVDLLGILMGGDLSVTWKAVNIVLVSVGPCSPAPASSAHSASAPQGIVISPFESDDENEEAFLTRWGKWKSEESSSGSSPKRPTIRVVFNPATKPPSSPPAITEPSSPPATTDPSLIVPLRSIPMQSGQVDPPIDRITSFSPPASQIILSPFRGGHPLSPPNRRGESSGSDPFDDFRYELGHGDEIPPLTEEERASPFSPNWSLMTGASFDSAETSHDFMEHYLPYGERVFNRGLRTYQLSREHSFFIKNQLSRSVEMHHRILYFEDRYHTLLARHTEETKARLDEARAELQKVESIIQGSKLQDAEIARLKDEAASLSKLVEDKEAECVRVTSEVSLLHVDLDHSRGEIRQLEEKERRLNTQLARADEDKHHLETLIADKEDAWASERDGLTVELSTEKQQVETLKADLATMSAQKHALVRRIIALNKAAKSIGVQEGLAAGYAGSGKQVPLDSVEGHDLDAFQRLRDSTTVLQTSSNSLVSRLAGLPQASLDVLKSVLTEITQNQGEISIRKPIERNWMQKVKPGSQKVNRKHFRALHEVVQTLKCSPVLPDYARERKGYFARPCIAKILAYK